MMPENRFYLRILSPVHVGCDEVYEPMGFVVDENRGMLTAFDPLDFFRALAPQDKARYAAISRKGTIISLLELYGFMKGRQFQGHEVKLCEGMINHYRQTLCMKPVEGTFKKVQQELNNFSIFRTAFNEHDNRPYIPGSAVKGALRTAYLNRLAKTRKVLYEHRDRSAAHTLEKQLLQYDKLEKDPFRLLKVSDFIPVQAITRVVYAVNEKKNRSNRPARGPYQIIEVIEPGALFTGTIAVDERHGREAGIREPLTATVLFESARDFYSTEIKRERDELASAALPAKDFVDTDGGWPLRIGRHSGAESVTIAGHRSIKIIQGRDKPPKFSPTGATTFWLASESRSDYERERLQPFGWAALGIVTDTMVVGMEKARRDDRVAPIPVKVDLTVAPAAENRIAPKITPPAEEIWEAAYISFDAGGGGILKATHQSGKKAELRGREKAFAIVAESLQRKLFEKPRYISKVRVSVRAVGNGFEIFRVELVNP